MINWGSKHIAFLSGLFIALFMGALTIGTLCDLEIIDYASNLSHNHEKPENGNPEIHHLKQKKYYNHDNHGANQEQSNHHHKEDDDECCDDASTILASSLFSGIVKYDVPAVKYFFVGLIEFKPQITTQYQSDNVIYHEYDDPPPLNGFKLRVEIQSFLN